MLAHVVWTAILYALLTLVRAPSVWGIGRAADGSNPLATFEPRVSANLRNQFEWPLFFYVVGILSILDGRQEDPIFLGLAWVFIAGRLAHSLIQIGSSNVRLRGLVFTVNFFAVLAMWARYLQVG